jgi:hypothetical protein
VWSNRDRRRVRKIFASSAEAKAWRADALVALSQGGLRARSPDTVRQAAKAFLEGAEAGTVLNRSGRTYKPSTRRSYRQKLDGYVLPKLGAYKLSDLRRSDVQAFADELVAGELGPSAIRNTLDPTRPQVTTATA